MMAECVVSVADSNRYFLVAWASRPCVFWLEKCTGETPMPPISDSNHPPAVD